MILNGEKPWKIFYIQTECKKGFNMHREIERERETLQYNNGTIITKQTYYYKISRWYFMIIY